MAIIPDITLITPRIPIDTDWSVDVMAFGLYYH